MTGFRYSVIIVDDSFYMRTLLRNILIDAGYKVIGECATLESLMQEVEKHTPDLFTLDMVLPDGSGISILEQLKVKFPNSKVVMLSAVSEESTISEALKLGADAYILKPFNEEKVLEIVDSIFQ